jgi:hypothetical protein
MVFFLQIWPKTNQTATFLFQCLMDNEIKTDATLSEQFKNLIVEIVENSQNTSP